MCRETYVYSAAVRDVLTLWHPVEFKGLFTHIPNDPEYNNIITEMRNNMNNLLSIINEKMNKESSDFKAILEGLLKLTTYIDELSTHLESQ